MASNYLGDRWAFGPPSTPVNSRRRRRLSITSALVALSVFVSSAALANDKLTSDADLLTLGLQQSYTNNSLASGATANFTLSLYVEVVSGGTEPSYPIDVRVKSKPSWVSEVTTFPVSIAGTGTGNAVSVTFQATGQPSSASGTIVFGAYPSGSTSELGQSLIQTNAQSDFTVSVSPPAVADGDGDGVADGDDNCPLDANPGQEDADGDDVGDACDDNSYAPQVLTAADDVNGDEGSALNTSGAFSDDDGNGTLTVSKVSGAGDVTDNGDGTWSWTYTSADDDSGTVVVKATDGEHTDATDSFDWSAANVAPTVSSNLLSPSVDCQSNATLENIYFSDPGVNDADWTVNIDWGDESTDTNYTTDTQGNQTDRSHLYTTPGTYTVTLTVTDKDGGVGTDADADNAISVTQEYSVSFKAPFDTSNPSRLITNKMKNGRVVPTKAVIFDVCTQAYVTDADLAQVSIGVKKANDASGTTYDPIESYADAGASSGNTEFFRWSTDGFWIYNLDSKALGLYINTTYRIDVYVDGAKATDDEWALLMPVK